MTTQKFEIEINTLKTFFELYCKNKHEDQKENTIKLEYKDISVDIELHLCEECLDSINYSFDRLLDCPHDIKPRCRTCPTPCYEKQRWKNAAKVMKYAAINLSLTKAKKKIKKLFTN